MSLRPDLKRPLGRAMAAVAALALCWGLPAFGAYRRGRSAAKDRLSLPPALAVSNAGPRQRSGLVVGYYPDHARSQGFLPADILAEPLTHIHYAFADISEEGRVVLSDRSVDLPNLAELRALREGHPGLKILLSVGGWGRSGGFSDAAADEDGRERFAQSAAELAADIDLDGIDLDWEFPVSGGQEGTPHRAEDRENFTLLLKKTREALDRKGEEEGKEYLLSAAVPPGRELLNDFQPAAIADSVDYLFLMGYDINGPWDSAVGFNAPLDPPGPGDADSVREGVESWIKAGVPRSKLVLGMPLYGYRYQLSPGGTGLYSAFASADAVSYDRLAARYLPDAQRFFHPAAQVPYLLGEGWFLSYDDPSSIAVKARFAQGEGLLGIGFWELSQDREGRLISAGASAWN